MKKRILTGLLALCVTLTAIPAETAFYAAGMPNEKTALTVGAETTEASEETGAAGETETSEVTETTETTKITEAAETTEITETTEAAETTETTETTEATETTETTEITEAAETTEITEATEITGDTETTAETETEDTEQPEETTELKSAEVSAGKTYATATELEFDKDYVSATKANVAGWYQFTLEKAGMVSFTFTHDRLADTSGNTTAWSITFAAENSTLSTENGFSFDTGMYTMTSGSYDTVKTSPQVGLPAGTYRIKITPKTELAGGQAYGLRLSYRDVFSETEENNSASSADELPLDTEITGSLYSASDTDYYKVTVTEDGYVNMYLNHDKVSGKENINLFHVSFCDSTQKVLYDMYSTGAETTTSSIKIGATKGDYLVKVEGGVLSMADPYTGNYGLRVTSTASGNWEKESNDTTSLANPVVPGETYGGDIRSSSDVDYFTLTTTEKGYLGLDFEHTVISGWETLSVYKITVSRNGQSGAVYTGYVKGGDATFTMPNLGLPADTYYIKIEPAATISTSLTGGSISSCYPADYSIKVNWQNASNWEEEVNNTISTANTIKSGTAYNGSIATTDDKDYYKVEMNKKGYLQFKFTHANTGNTATHYRISVLNSAGSNIYEVTNAGVDTLYVSDKIGLAKGTYYVLVSVSSTLYTGDYGLTVTTKAASNWESEVNGDTATANSLKVGKEMHGVISSYSGDLDYYKFTLDKTSYVNVSLSHKKMNVAGTSWYVYLLKSNGSRLNYLTDHLYSYAGDAYTESTAIKMEKGTYYVVVRAAAGNKNAVGEEYTVSVNKISAKKPKVSSVKSGGYHKLKVTWKAVPGAVSYTIARSTSKDGSYTEVKTIDNVSTISWTDKSVTTGKTYYYKVKAKVALENTTKESGYSKAVSGKAVPAKTTVKTALKNSKVKVSWKKVSGANGYEIVRSTKKDKGYKKIKTIKKGSAKTYTDSKTKSGKTYYYKIRAYRNVNGKKVYGSYSKVVSRKVK